MTPIKQTLLRLSGQLLKWYLIIASGLVSTLIILLVVGLSILLYYPKTAQLSLPYLSDFTDGQLQIESAEGKLVDGLVLRNIQFNNSAVNVNIDQVDWQWDLSALFNRHLHFQTLNITQPTIQLIASDQSAEPPAEPNSQPFAILTQLNEYQLRFDIDQLAITNASLQFENEPPIQVAEFKSGLHWQEQTLTVTELSTDYQTSPTQTFKLKADSQFEVLNATEFKIGLNLNVMGIEGFEPLKIRTQATGGLEQINFSLDLLAPYAMHSEHVLKMGKTVIELDSEFKQLKAKLNEQWQINQLQGRNQLSFNLENKTLKTAGNFTTDLAGKPTATLNYKADYAKDGAVNYQLQTAFDQMGSLKTQGQANVLALTANATAQTENLNLQWVDNALNYQISSLFDFKLTDFKALKSQLDIQTLEVTGLPEAFAFKGIITSQLKTEMATRSSAPNAKPLASKLANTANDYAINIQSGQLSYADYSGQILATIFASPDFKRFDVPYANLTLGDNSVHASGQWAESLNLNVNAALNQLSQMYAPLNGQVIASINSHGTLLKDFSGFEQAWSTVTLNAENVRYQAPDAVNGQALTVNNVTLNGRIPLHKPAWSAFNLSASDIQQTANKAEPQTLLSQFTLSRQASENGLSSELNIIHPEIKVHAELYEDKPNLEKQTLVLRAFDIEQETTGFWKLDAPKNLFWKAPTEIKTEQICLRPSNQSTANPSMTTELAIDEQPVDAQTPQPLPAKLCLQAESNRAEWSMQALPILDWLKPWLSDALVLKGTLSGEGSANWQNALKLKQSLLVPQLDITVVEQGYELPILIKDWQTDLQMTDTQVTLKSLAHINQTGRLDADIILKNKQQQAWSEAALNGKVNLEVNEWQLSDQVLQLAELNKTVLHIHSALSGSLASLQHDTQANVDLNLNLPLLGLSNQAIRLQAQLTPEVIEASGVWKQREGQTDERRADLTVNLTQLTTKPALLANFKTDSIELLKTPFANLKTASDITVTLADGLTHIQGGAKLHDSLVNLDEMPIQDTTSTSGDEIIINEQGEVVPKENATSNLSYDLKIGFGDNVEVKVRDSQLLLGGELQVVQELNARDMQAFGEVKLVGGYINLDERNRIQIAESGFIFNSKIANPTLDVNLFRVVDQTTARLNITGNAAQPQFVFYSTPALSQGRIINLMVFGRAGDMSKEPNYESQVLSAFYKLGIQNNTPVLNTLTSTLGIQDVYLDVQDQKVSSLLVGRALTDKLYVRYAKDLTGQQSSAVQFFYQLTNKWLLKTNSGDNNSSVDVIYRIERD
ncbi:MAG: translocation/assembly module TamB domain-containing protein [Thiotrichales bacterium]|nr:translocation/assembly module TamB domain-containing protein [Thiotrichales bacterium]